MIRINRGADGIAGNQVAQLSLTIAMCLLIVTLVFRSFGLGVLAMPTNVVPVFLFYGALGAGVAPLSIPISLIGSVALGITVDDTSPLPAGVPAPPRRGHAGARKRWSPAPWRSAAPWS